MNHVFRKSCNMSMLHSVLLHTVCKYHSGTKYPDLDGNDRPHLYDG